MAYWIQPIEYSRDFGHDRSYTGRGLEQRRPERKVAVHALRRVRFHPAPQPAEFDPGQHPGGADPAGVIAGAAGRLSADGLAGGDHRGHRHHRDGDHHLACPGRADARSLVTRGGDRDLVDRLDRLLGGGDLQRPARDRRLRGAQALAGHPGVRRRAGPGHPARLGAGRAAGRAGGVRLSLGGDRAHPGRPGRGGDRRDPGGRHRQQRAGLLRRPRHPDHRARRRHRGTAALPVRLGGPDRGDRRPAPAVDPHLSGLRPARPAGDLAAAGGGLPGLRRRPVPDLAVARALPARRHRRAGLLRRAAVAAEVLEARRDPRLRRRPGQHGSRARGRRGQRRRVGRHPAGQAADRRRGRGTGPVAEPAGAGGGTRRRRWAPGETGPAGGASGDGGPQAGVPANGPAQPGRARCARRSPGWSRLASWS